MNRCVDCGKVFLDYDEYRDHFLGGECLKEKGRR